MGSSKKGSSQASTAIEFEIRLAPHCLSMEEDDERIKRLSRKILACIEASKRDGGRAGRSRRKRAVEILEPEGEAVFGE